MMPFMCMEKTVMLLLPARKTVVETVETVLVPPGDKEDIASQQRHILCQARQQMEEMINEVTMTVCPSGFNLQPNKFIRPAE